MDFYFNENQLISCLDDISENLKEIKEIYNFAKIKNYEIYIKKNIDIDYKKLCNKPQILLALGLLKYLKNIETDECDMLADNQIEPCIDNYYFIELVSLCYEYNNNRIISLSTEREVINPQYRIYKDKKPFLISNIIGKNEFEEYSQFNPVPQNISEVFEKAELEFKHIKFTEKAYKTANSRSDIYKQVGFLNLLNVFKVLETLIYPFLKGELEGYNQERIEEEFKKQTKGIEFSNESDKTMNKYGYQRTVSIKGEKLTMRYHIKPNDNRIYFIYHKKDDCIYIGHSGGHLDVAG